jgi:hypothetical protein
MHTRKRRREYDRRWGRTGLSSGLGQMDRSDESEQSHLSTKERHITPDFVSQYKGIRIGEEDMQTAQQ